MSPTSDAPEGDQRDRDPSDVDPIDVEAAQIDARAPDAAEDVAGLAAHAAELGRDTDPAPVDVPDDVDVEDPTER